MKIQRKRMQTKEEHRVTYSAILDHGYRNSVYLMGHNSAALRLLLTLANNCKKNSFFHADKNRSNKIQTSVLLAYLQCIINNVTEML
jgi:hypothetical protein